MASGSMPTYSYRPPARTGTAGLRTCSSRRARLFAGGTYFRSRDPGLQSNNLSVEVIEVQPFNPLTGEDGLAFCVITNHNVKFDENVQGLAKVSVLNLTGTYADLWQFKGLDTITPQCEKYSTSVQIRFWQQEGIPYDLDADPNNLVESSFTGKFSFDKLFTHSGKIAVKMSRNDAPYAPESVISVALRCRIYALSTTSKVVSTPVGEGATSTSTTSYGWDIADLRAQVNATDPWVEMLERSGPDTSGAFPVPNPNPSDYQDPGTDADFLTPFNLTRLTGGDGLPENPNAEVTGPSRSIVHVNYGELQNGQLAEHNTVYEWVGDTATSGSWKAY